MLRVVRTKKDRGLKKALNEMKRLSDKPSHVEVGVFDPAIAPRATAHELGMGVPVRSWLRGTVQEHGRSALAKALKAHLQKQRNDAGLITFAEHVVSLIQGRLRGSIDPPLKEPNATGTNLIDTEAFANAITWRFGYKMGRTLGARVRRTAKRLRRFFNAR